jgi:Rrf2 family protein
VISITSKSRYAVVAMAELARSGDRPVPIKEVAERRGMPDQFLEQLFSTLRRAGLLTSPRGMKGGYTLSRPADEITVLEVVQTLDGKIGQEAEEAGGIWAEGVASLRKVFGQTTIAEVARREAEEAGAGMYFILGTGGLGASGPSPPRTLQELPERARGRLPIGAGRVPRFDLLASSPRPLE